MKQHEREFFISLIRCGKVFINHNNLRLVIKPLTLDQVFESCEVYNTSYNQGYIDGIMTEEEMNDWMVINELWDRRDDELTEKIKKDIEQFKVEIYNARNNTPLREGIRSYLRAAESKLGSHLQRKNQYFQNTTEGYASIEKLSWCIRNSTYCNDKLYDFNEISLQYVVDEWQSSFLTDKQSRELARNEPWKSLWIVRENANTKLFNISDNCELTHNQKNLIIWSQMYDNIQESLDCPSKDVIEDDDMLDGWFIIQGKKREKERAEQELDKNIDSNKIKNSSEVFVIADNDADANKINNLNDSHAAIIKRQREALIRKKGSVTQDQFADEKLKMITAANQKFASNFKGGQ